MLQINESAAGEVTEAKAGLRWPRKQAGPLAGFLSGTLLMVAGMFPVLAPVHMIAFVPVLLGLRSVRQWRDCIHTGFLMGLGFIAPQLLWLMLPPIISLILVAYFIVAMLILTVAAWYLVAPAGSRGCFAFGAMLAVFDWVIVTAMPMWGTAQSLVRCWSWYPGAIAFTCATGTAGLIFVLGTIQALAVNAVLNGRRRVASVLSLAGVLAIVIVADAVVLSRKPTGQLKVAAIGWVISPRDGGMGTAGAFDRLYAEPLAEAARQGARLIVSPETAFVEHDDPDRHPLGRFVDLAQRHNVYLAVGYLDTRSHENRMAFIAPSGDIVGRYTKTHLTPFEDNPMGTGDPTVIIIDGITVGAMVCHDDNYTDISRRYGALPAGIVVVPTNDWKYVRKAHFQSSIHRAIESRFAMVRAASNGISAVISATGKRLAVNDHFKDGPGPLIAEVEVCGTRTIFSRFGYWFVVLCGLFIIVHVVLCRRYPFSLVPA
jgi:apolipoprotein N-acyltransferase